MPRMGFYNWRSSLFFTYGEGSFDSYIKSLFLYILRSKRRTTVLIDAEQASFFCGARKCSRGKKRSEAEHQSERRTHRAQGRRERSEQ